MRTERLRNGWRWWRIAENSWRDPLDPRFARRRGGRWNPPDSFDTLYLNEDTVTARLNLRAFIADWPYEPEDLRSGFGPVLIGATIPRDQDVCDVHTRDGVSAVGLPAGFPLDARGHIVAHAPCQAIGRNVKARNLRGVRARSAQARDGAGRELAWFPATAQSRARRVERLAFDDWFWS